MAVEPVIIRTLEMAPKSLIKRTERIRTPGKSWNHPGDCPVESHSDTEKSAGVLRKVAIT